MRESLFALVMTLVATVSSAQNFVDAGGGVRIWYSDRGSGSPLVVIHGGPGMDHLSLEADFADLAKHHRMIYYDQRGGGQSSLPSDVAQLTIEHHVADLEALRKHLGLEKMTLVAHSFGPAIAALYAIRYPEHIERMILLSPIPPRKGAFFEEFGAAMTTRLTEAQSKRGDALQKSFETSKDVPAICREYWSIMTPPRLAKASSSSMVKSDFCKAPAEAIRFGLLKTNPATFTSLGDWDWRKQLAVVKAPVLIIHGTEDAIPMAMVNEWVTAFPSARILRVKNAAHFPHAEQPSVVFPAIETFLGGEWPAGAIGK